MNSSLHRPDPFVLLEFSSWALPAFQCGKDEWRWRCLICCGAMQVGPRLPKDRERFPPNNMLLMLTGAGLLWMGWSGFNGGAPFSANIVSGLAVLNTHVCAATSLLTWTTLDVIIFGKPSVIGAVQGMMTGLVTITPAAGEKFKPLEALTWFCRNSKIVCKIDYCCMH